MLVKVCKSKIHRVKVTEADLDYEGSITLDQKLIEEVNILPYEMVLVLNLNNGARFDTYVIPGEADSGIVCLNGPAARLGQVGDLLIVISSGWMDEKEAELYKPKTVHVDNQNRIKG